MYVCMYVCMYVERERDVDGRKHRPLVSFSLGETRVLKLRFIRAYIYMLYRDRETGEM